ncbi:hypothetical protein D3C85_1517920 [compost metagenome]
MNQVGLAGVDRTLKRWADVIGALDQLTTSSKGLGNRDPIRILELRPVFLTKLVIHEGEIRAVGIVREEQDDDRKFVLDSNAEFVEVVEEGAVSRT